MRTLYLDCFAGAAGDMIVGALLNLVPSPSVLRDGLKKVTALAPEEYELVIEEGVKNGIAGINEATSMVSSYFDPGTKLIYAIGAVVGLIGGVKVYGKFSSGDPDTSKTAASWFGACIFLIVAATILRSFFL